MRPRVERLFLYGSLQPGAWNFERWLPAGTPSYRAYARGSVCLTAFTYPVAKFHENGNAIRGHVVDVDLLSRDWHDIFEMETGAGYHLVEVPTFGMHGSQAFRWQGDSLAFESNYSLAGMEPVPNGDWLAWYLSRS